MQSDSKRHPSFNRVFVELHKWPCWRACGATVSAFSITCTGGASAGRTEGSCWAMVSRVPTSVCPGPAPARPPLQTPLSPPSLRLQLPLDPLLLSCSGTTASGSPRSLVYSPEHRTAWAANASYMKVCWQLDFLFVLQLFTDTSTIANNHLAFHWRSWFRFKFGYKPIAVVFILLRI